MQRVPPAVKCTVIERKYSDLADRLLDSTVLLFGIRICPFGAYFSSLNIPLSDKPITSSSEGALFVSTTSSSGYAIFVQTI